MNKKRLIVLILVIIAVWYFAVHDRKPAQAPTTTSGVANEEAKYHNAPQSTLALSGGDIAEGKARVHFFTKDAVANCSTATSAVELAIDSKYGHPAAGALVAMTLPLPAEQAEKYVSTLPSGTRLLTMQIDRDGIAHANYNSTLNAPATDCIKAERRVQIEATLKEFSQIKSVVITVEGKVWQ